MDQKQVILQLVEDGRVEDLLLERNRRFGKSISLSKQQLFIVQGLEINRPRYIQNHTNYECKSSLN